MIPIQFMYLRIIGILVRKAVQHLDSHQGSHPYACDPAVGLNPRVREEQPSMKARRTTALQPGKKYRQIAVGERFQETTTITDQMVREFARATGDANPVHLDDAYAATTLFKRRIAHGMLVAGLISRALGMSFPGAGTIYLRQQLEFIRPVFIGDVITVQLEVVEKIDEKKAIRVTTTCSNHSGKSVLAGEAIVIPPR
jgi:3-hydroxybutyryl-CoA dehydratase